MNDQEENLDRFKCHACVSYAFSVDYRTMLSGEIKVLASRLAGWRKLNYTLLTFPKSPVVSDHSSVSCNYKPGNSFPTSMRTSIQQIKIMKINCYYFSSQITSAKKHRIKTFLVNVTSVSALMLLRDRTFYPNGM